MNTDNLARANKINNNVENINRILDDELFGVINDITTNNNRNSCLCHYPNGSGWNIDLGGTGVDAIEFIHAIEDILIKKRCDLTSEFNEI